MLLELFSPASDFYVSETSVSESMKALVLPNKSVLSISSLFFYGAIDTTTPFTSPVFLI